MKRIIALLSAALFAFSVNAATLNSIQLLNPVGSTSGQAIISTGASTAPTWGNPTASYLSQSANTVLANATGSPASPIAVSVPSCSATGNNLQWTSGTGFTCATGYALLASPTFTGTVTTAALTSTGLITPSSTIGIKGTATNDNAQAGSVGEYVTGTTLGTSITAGTPYNAASISLTAGDWDVSGTISFIGGAGANSSVMNASISQTSATQNTTIGFMSSSPNATAAATTTRLATPVVRISLAATTTVYLVGVDAFSGGTVTSDGMIRARRVR